MVTGHGLGVRAPIIRGGLVEDLVQPGRRKIGELHFDDRPHSLDGRANGGADDGVLADRRVKLHIGRGIRWA